MTLYNPFICIHSTRLQQPCEAAHDQHHQQTITVKHHRHSHRLRRPASHCQDVSTSHAAKAEHMMIANVEMMCVQADRLTHTRLHVACPTSGGCVMAPIPGLAQSSPNLKPNFASVAQVSPMYSAHKVPCPMAASYKACWPRLGIRQYTHMCVSCDS